MKLFVMSAIFAFLPVTALAQETVRQVDGAGRFTKYLTPGLLDHWILEGEKGETIIAHVTTKDFDPILELASKGITEDKVLFSVDDEGSESRFAFRLPEAGRYKIRVHAFKYKGGGNYSLHIRRFQATPVVIEKRIVGTFNERGRGYHYFEGVKDRILIPEVKGGSTRTSEILDIKGRSMRTWSGSVLVEEAGIHSMILSGRAGNRYELIVREANRNDLADGKKRRGQLDMRSMDVWNFEGNPGEFRFLELETKGQLASRLVFAPRKKNDDLKISRAGNRPEIQFMPVGSKGGRLRYAVVLGRKGRYQLQLFGRTPTSYELQMGDASQPITTGKKQRGSLPIGGSAFYRFEAKPGQLIQADLSSKRFDSLLRLYNSRGDLIQQNDDGDGGMGSRISHMVMKKDVYRLQVSSVGNGGGGDYDVSLQEKKLKQLSIGKVANGTIFPQSTDYWTFSGKEGTTIILHVRSSECDPSVRLYGPNGVSLGNDDNGGVGTDCLLAVRLPRSGSYTVWISSRRGAGRYSIQLIDGDQ